jgi:XTP/dITP diphosphohydrolase
VAAVSQRTTVVVASNNRSKILEFRGLLADLPIEVLGLSEVLSERLTIVEDGKTFEENALKKANGVAEAVLMLTLADDSGLEVDALGGRPGVRSARFAHDRATDAENNAALLTALAEIEEEHRTARFRCVLALIDPFATEEASPIVVEGTCQGSISREPRGAGGFGYDPLFVVRGKTRTMAELTDEEKNALSHRAKAVELLKPSLAAILRTHAEQAARLTSA